MNSQYRPLHVCAVVNKNVSCNSRFKLMHLFRFFSAILFGASVLIACGKVNVTDSTEHKALCSQYGHTLHSYQFSKCVKRQNIIANYENENWLLLTLGLK